MSTQTKHAILNLIFCAAVFVAAIAMIIAYRLYGFRAALLTFAAECATVAMSLAAYLQDELPDDEAPKEEPEQYETRKLKCADCGETFECHIVTSLPDEKKREFQLLCRCPLCGGELKEEHEEQGHVQ